MADIALYFGSFNPIHNGHTAVARWVLERGLCDELWFVVSPQNPLKDVRELAPAEDRLAMAAIACREELDGLAAAVSDVEFALPRPGYTIDTLKFLARERPHDTFSLLAGADIMEQLEQWKDYRSILSFYRLLIYPRAGYPVRKYRNDVVLLEGAPRWDFSSTDIRRTLAAGGDIGGMVCPGVAQYIGEHRLWS